MAAGATTPPPRSGSTSSVPCVAIGWPWSSRSSCWWAARSPSAQAPGEVHGHGDASGRSRVRQQPGRRLDHHRVDPDPCGGLQPHHPRHGVQQDVAQRLKRASVPSRAGSRPPRCPAAPHQGDRRGDVRGRRDGAGNAGRQCAQAYVNHEVRATDVTASLSKRYEDGGAGVSPQEGHERPPPTSLPAESQQANRSARDDAAAATDSASLTAETLKSSYQQAVAGGTASAVVQNFSRAGAATSDRKETMQILVFVGLLGGIAAGVALALLGAYREAAEPARVTARASARRDRRGRRRRGVPRRAHLPRAPARSGRARRHAVPEGRRPVIAISVGYMVWRLEPAYTISAAVFLSPFAGNWPRLGVPGPLSPDRLLLAGGILAVLLRSFAPGRVRGCGSPPPTRCWPWPSSTPWARPTSRAR